jgi:hypothetical protein
VSERLRVLDELERRLIAGCFGSAIAAEPGSRRRRLRVWASRLASRWPRWGLAVPAVGLVVTVVVVAVVIASGLRHQRGAPVQRPVLQQPYPPVVRNYAHSKLPPLPRDSVRYSSGHFGASAYSQNPRDTFVLTATRAASVNPSGRPRPSTLTIRASGLKPAPRGSVYAVWLTQAIGGHAQIYGPARGIKRTTVQTPLRPKPPFSLLGFIQPPIGADGELTTRVPLDVPVFNPGTGLLRIALLITIERNPNAKTPSRPVLVAVIY